MNVLHLTPYSRLCCRLWWGEAYQYLDFLGNGGAGSVGNNGWYRANLSELAVEGGLMPCEVLGGDDIMMLFVPDGGIGQETIEGENTPLLAMLTAPIESWL